MHVLDKQHSKYQNIRVEIIEMIQDHLTTVVIPSTPASFAIRYIWYSKGTSARISLSVFGSYNCS